MIKMRCEDLQELLALASGGDVTQEEWRSVSDHIESCESCRRLYKAYCLDRERMSLLRGLRLRDRVSERLTVRGRRVMRRPVSWVVGVLGFAAAAAVALALTLFLTAPAPQEPAPLPTPPAMTAHEDLPEFLKNAFENASIKGLPQRQPKYERCRILQEADAKIDF